MTTNIYVRGTDGESVFTPLSVIGMAQLGAPVLRAKTPRKTGPRSKGKYFWVDNGSHKRVVLFTEPDIEWDRQISSSLTFPMRVMVEMKTEADEVSLVVGLVSALRVMGGRNILLREEGDDGVLGTFIEFEEYVTNHGGSYHGLDLLKMGGDLAV